jgi:hypothetical protein
MTIRTDTPQIKHQKAAKFFWSVLIGATLISLAGNVVHAVLPYVPTVVVQIAAAAVPPLVLLAAVHGIALAVRAGASGTVYRCAVGSVALIAVGAFSVSFLALRDLMISIGYSPSAAWIFPLIIDTAVAVSTVMLVALGDKPQCRARTAKPDSPAQVRPRGANSSRDRGTKSQAEGADTLLTVQDNIVAPVQTDATGRDADLAAALVAARVTTQPVEVVVSVLAAHRSGASINASAKTAGVNYRTAQRIINGAAELSSSYAVAC